MIESRHTPVRMSAESDFLTVQSDSLRPIFSSHAVKHHTRMLLTAARLRSSALRCSDAQTTRTCLMRHQFTDDAEQRRPQLLVLAHSPSPNTQLLRASCVDAASSADATVEVVVRDFPAATSEDVLRADGVLLLTLENLSYMSGLTKDFWDRSYNALVGQRNGLPVAVIVRAGSDGAVLALCANGVPLTDAFSFCSVRKRRNAR